ncbi:MAG: RNA polymerase sigma factor [Pseudomonadales bacterium]|nr:RNA polymerase sigma factor [Pseudomonadales bacterium]
MPVNGLINDVFLSCRVQLARAVSRIVPPHDIEDIVQETYVRACQFGAKNEVREPRALMVKIARNLALDRIKLASTRLKSSEDFETVLEHLHQDIDEPFNEVASGEEFAQFCEAVRELPKQCRRGFVLKKVYGYSQTEIARELNISESTVEKHIAKGMKLCVQFMLAQRDINRVSSITASLGASSLGDSK